MSDIPKLWLDGAFNHADPWLNIPFYIWGLVLWWIIVIPVAWFILKSVKWDRFSKFHGLHYAKKNDSAAVIIVDYMGEADMIAENKAKCIFDYSQDDYEIEIPDIPLNIVKGAAVVLGIVGVAITFKVNMLIGIPVIILAICVYFVEKLLPWITSALFFYPTHYLSDISWNDAILYKIGGINYDCKIAQILQGGEWGMYPVVNCGGIPVEIIYDMDKWCKKNSPQNKAIKKFAKQWNIDNPDNQIHTFSKLTRLHSEGLIKDSDIPEITFEFVVPWVRIDTGFPYYPISDYDGKLRQMAQLKKNAKDQISNKYILWIVVAGVIVLILILGVRALMKLLA